MKTLQQILSKVAVLQIIGDDNVRVSALSIDSRQIEKGAAFVAIRGISVDGHQFIETAVKHGAAVILCEQFPAEMSPAVTYVKVQDTALAAGEISSAFYGHPSLKLKVVGVTGTNGKTTVTTLLYKLFRELGYKTGLLSTVQNLVDGKVIPATHTTPDAISIHSLLAAMVEAGCSHAFMEVSSHAIHQKRIAGIHFTGGVFTNITHDHLDYHKTFEEYIRVKKKFFDDLSSNAFALTNLDDKRGAVMLQNTLADKNSYSLKSPATFKGRVLENHLSGLVMMVDQQEAHFRMIGTFNAYNLLGVYGAGVLLGEDKMQVLSILTRLQGAAGRFETLRSARQHILGIIDYAHTPDALINVLATINQLRKNAQKLITVVGCGGDRDITKRPLMARAACEHSDMTILTSDNPRSEDPEAILDQMEEGLQGVQKRKVLRITDRREAIKTACMLAEKEDIILIAGKGHETYQEVKGTKHPFDDKEILRHFLETLEK